MRDRHFPRVCQACGAPMARQTDACWRCGIAWATEHEPGGILVALPEPAPATAAPLAAVGRP